MEESENQVLTAKADEAAEGKPEGSASAAAAPKKKNRRAIWIVFTVLGACLLFGLGAVAGGGAVFALTRARSRVLVRPSVERWVLPREMPHMDRPMRPGRGTIGFGAGAVIVEVVPDGPADRAGLREGNLLVAIEGEKIGEKSDLAALIAGYEPGTKVTIEVAEFGPQSDQASRAVTVTLAEHPDAEGKAYLGVTFVPMSHDEFGDEGGMFWFHKFDEDGPCVDCEDHDGRLERHFEFRWPRR